MKLLLLHHKMLWIFLPNKFLISSPFVRTLVYANVFIAIAAFAQLMVTYTLFPIPINFKNNSYLLFILLSTYLQYNMQRGYMINETNIRTERSQWLIRNKKILMYSVFLSLGIVLFLCNNLSYTSIGIMIGAEVVSTFYYLPPFNLRKHGYFKPFLIAAVWVISCSVVPLIEHDMISKASYGFFIAQFCFTSILCLMFDIKDVETDYMSGVNTYANKFGAGITKLISVALLIMASISFYAYTKELTALLCEGIVLGITLLTILFTNDKKHDFYYYLWVDGLLLLQALVFVAAYYK